MLDLYILAQEKYEETSLPLESWLDVFNRAQVHSDISGLEAEVFEKLARASHSPFEFNSVSIILERNARQFPNHIVSFSRLAKSVDASPYSLAEWIEAIEDFYAWLKEHKSVSDLRTMLGYLECAVAAIQNKPTPPPLRELLNDMLIMYGYDGAKKNPEDASPESSNEDKSTCL